MLACTARRSSFGKAGADRLSHQVVHERVRRAVDVHQPRPRDVGQRTGRLGAHDGGEHRIGHRPTDDRRDCQHVPLEIAQGVDAVVDGALHAERLGGRGVRGRLDDEERIATGESAEVLGLGQGRRGAESVPQLLDAVVVEAAQNDGEAF